MHPTFVHVHDSSGAYYKPPEFRFYGFRDAASDRMRPRICVCCGEPIAEQGNQLSRNPNVCASCSSLADGMEDSALPASVPSQIIPSSVAGVSEEVEAETHTLMLPS
jgi:hypothetical protein